MNTYDTEMIAEEFGESIAKQIKFICPAKYEIVDKGVVLTRMDDGKYIAELSNDLLARYKDMASDDASKADKAMNFKRGDKRFSGIVKATKKQFTNDTKVNEASANNTSAHVAATSSNKKSISKDSKNGLIKPKNDKELLALATIKSIKGK